MKTFNLKSCGINPLTGEACAYGMRVLCDLNEAGAQLIRQYYGLPYDATLAANWNSTVDGQPAIASIMLCRSEYMNLIEFAWYQSGLPYAYRYANDDTVHGFDTANPDVYPALAAWVEGGESVPDNVTLYRNHRSAAPQVDGRNVHAFTGRSI